MSRKGRSVAWEASGRGRSTMWLRRTTPAPSGLALEPLGQLARRREHGLGVAGNLHLAPDALDDAVAVDEERGAVDAHIFAAVQALFDPGAEGFADRPIRIGRERHLEVVFFGVLAVFPRISIGDAKDPSPRQIG